MESATCLSSCSVVLRYLVSGAGVIHGEFPLRLYSPFLQNLACDAIYRSRSEIKVSAQFRA